MLRVILLIVILSNSYKCLSQFNGRLILGIDLYQWYRNPHTNSSQLEGSSGGVLPFILGTEIMAGKNNYSIGLEADINLGVFNFDTEFKGLGALAIPILMKLNYGCLSGFSTKIIGASIAGGVQFQKTELFGLSSKYDQYERKFFPTYVGQIDLAGGLGGLNFSYYIRIGMNPDKPEAFSLNTGILTRINYFKKKLDSKNSNPLKS